MVIYILIISAIIVILYFVYQVTKKKKTESKPVIIVNEEDKKGDWEAIERLLKEKNIDCFYHFTDRENIKSILNYEGLFSWDYCEKNNIKISKPGGNDLSRCLDLKRSLENFVRLSFVQNHPMLYIAKKDGRIQNPIILKIAWEVALLRETKFSNINTTSYKNIPTIDSTYDHLKNFNFELFIKNYFHLNIPERPYYQAEILVLEKIPLNFILNIDDFR